MNAYEYLAYKRYTKPKSYMIRAFLIGAALGVVLGITLEYDHMWFM